MLHRKKPMTRKKALRARSPMRAQRPKPNASSAADDAARRLWPLLEKRPGPPFAPAVRLGPYRADFVCPAAKIVILLASTDDPQRHDWLVAQGYRVLSFDAADSPQSVLDAVAAAFTPRVIGR